MHFRNISLTFNQAEISWMSDQEFRGEFAVGGEILSAVVFQVVELGTSTLFRVYLGSVEILQLADAGNDPLDERLVAVRFETGVTADLEIRQAGQLVQLGNVLPMAQLIAGQIQFRQLWKRVFFYLDVFQPGTVKTQLLQAKKKITKEIISKFSLKYLIHYCVLWQLSKLVHFFPELDLVALQVEYPQLR